MWSVQSEKLSADRGLRFTLQHEARAATFAEVIEAWQNEAEFRAWFNAILAGAPYTAFRWETPAVTSRALSQPFEFVLLDDPGLERRSDPDAFAEHLSQAKEGVAVFSNLGGDAIMIIPCQLGKPTAYGHLAAFTRHAPQPQQDALWRAVGETMTRRIGAKPVWLSTAGAGVAWLHVRLDDRPKYYGFKTYRNPPKTG
jgi:hypothetical protein